MAIMINLSEYHRRHIPDENPVDPEDSPDGSDNFENNPPPHQIEDRPGIRYNGVLKKDRVIIL
ncbi:MAG: hypothetical protein K0R14_2190 [Burkholderiales bacterium]|jgi:hypothetical protein|nr:hypothetical protein [Burkholderiales bacterium]